MPVYKAENGTWYAQYRDRDHKPHKKRGFARKRDAEEYLAAIKTDMTRGDYVDPTAGRTTIETLAKRWQATRSNLKPSTLNTERAALQKHVLPVWGNRRVGTIERSDVTIWVSELAASGLGATACRRAHGILSAILDFAVDDKRINKNPAKRIKNLPKRVKKQNIYLTHNQVTALAEASGDHALIIYLLAYSGLRWGELAALRVKNVDLMKARLQVAENAVDTGGIVELGTPKTHEIRSVPILNFMIGLLAEQCANKQPDDLVFPSRTGTFMRRPNTNAPKKSWFITAKTLSGVPERLTVHDLRHTAASLAISSGANVKAVQNMLGHSSAAMTLDVYADLFDDDMDTVAHSMNSARDSANVPKMFPIAPIRAKS